MDQLHLGAGAGVGTSSFGYDSYQNNHQPTYQPTPVVETTHSAGSNTTSSSTHSLLSKPRGGGLQLGGKRLLLVEPCHQVTVLMNHYLLLVNQCLPIRQQ